MSIYTTALACWATGALVFAWTLWSCNDLYASWWRTPETLLWPFALMVGTLRKVSKKR